MTTTFFFENKLTITQGGHEVRKCPDELLNRYISLVDSQRMSWTEHLRLMRLLGSGGQGVVYLSQRRGADGFTVPVALKIFSPERYEDARTYDEAMARMADVAARVSQIQQDNLLDVHNFADRNRIRLMEMEWVDGYDLSQLLTHKMLDNVRQRVSEKRWGYLNNVIITSGPIQPRIKAGIAVNIVRECLAALAALHRNGIVHGDIKPSNIMVKRTGNAKIIDIGSALDLNNMPQQKTCTPQYAAPEVLDREEMTPRSDLASVGYVFVELLAGRPLFADSRDLASLLDKKRTLPQWLHKVLPPEVRHSELLMTICRRLTAPDPMLRYATAEQADTGSEGVAEFQRTLVRGDLASEYENELRVWLEELD
jgi:serine/threonine-protein kinase